LCQILWIEMKMQLKKIYFIPYNIGSIYISRISEDEK
jgi:hypothetical protein